MQNDWDLSIQTNAIDEALENMPSEICIPDLNNEVFEQNNEAAEALIGVHAENSSTQPIVLQNFEYIDGKLTMTYSSDNQVIEEVKTYNKFIFSIKIISYSIFI